MSIDSKFDGVVEESSNGKKKYFVRGNKIYILVDGKEVPVPGRIVNNIAYRYVRGNLNEIGKIRYD